MQRGIFAVYKPSGVTSAAVTSNLKKILIQARANREVDCERDSPDRALPANQGSLSQQRRPIRAPAARRGDEGGARRLKVGHGGTLDSIAEGVLVVAIGDDCRRLAEFLGGDKCYECVGRLGLSTDTLCREGTVTEEKPYGHITNESLAQALASFEGEILQTPPVYSALKFKGRRLSDWTREGVVVDPPPRRVTIRSLSLLEFLPPHFRISLCCSSGTYVRSLVRDVGQKLGSAAHVVYLCRTRQGPFSLGLALRKHQWTAKGIEQAVAAAHATLQGAG